MNSGADLEELVGGHPDENVPGIMGDSRDVNAVPETEWKLMQLDTCNADKGSSQLVNHGGSSHGVVRRYEFYKYTRNECSGSRWKHRMQQPGARHDAELGRSGSEPMPARSHYA